MGWAFLSIFNAKDYVFLASRSSTVIYILVVSSLTKQDEVAYPMPIQSMRGICDSTL